MSLREPNFIPLDVEVEKKRLKRAGSLHGYHWIVIVCSLLLTIVAWYISHSQQEEKIKTSFNREVDQTIELIQERLKKYEDILWVGVSFYNVENGSMDFDKWERFTKDLQVEKKYPGINGLGVIHKVMPEQLDDYLAKQRILRPMFKNFPERINPKEYFIIGYIVPVEDNLKAVGLDIAFEKNRYNSILKSIDTGSAQITGPIVLVQDQEKTPGFLFYAPLYKKNNLNNALERRDNAIGAVYSPFISKKLMLGVLQAEKRNVGLKITDNDEVIYDELNDKHPNFDASPYLKKSVTLELYGRNWNFEFWSSKSFLKDTKNYQPKVILFCGLFINALLFLLFLMLSRANKRAINFADTMNKALEKKAYDLEKSNKDIEQLSYLAAHDLKTPMRGVKTLIGFMEDDIEDLKIDAVKPILEEYSKRINQQMDLSARLLDDLLEYTTLVNKKNEGAEWIDINELVQVVCSTHNLKLENINLNLEVKKVYLPEILLKSVFNNLISNALKYGSDENIGLRLDISVSQFDDEYMFSVRDYGKGIPDGKELIIFDIFKTLNKVKKGETPSTGLGLSIVKKIITNAGGTINATNMSPPGLKFKFTWPMTKEEV